MSDKVDKAEAWDAISAKNTEIASLRARLAEVKGERDRLREALGWYADPAHYEEGRRYYALDPGYSEPSLHPVLEDKGDRARAALEGQTTGGTENYDSESLKARGARLAAARKETDHDE